MNPVLTTLKQMFKTNNFIMSKGIDDLSDEEILTRPNKDTNSLLYILGHLVTYRYQICKALGVEIEHNYDTLFDYGGKITDNTKFPTVATLKDDWAHITDKLYSAIDNATDEILQKEIPNKQPIGEKNILGAVSFLAFHESYHIGQVAFIRKYLGHDQVVG